MSPANADGQVVIAAQNVSLPGAGAILDRAAGVAPVRIGAVHDRDGAVWRGLVWVSTTLGAGWLGISDSHKAVLARRVGRALLRCAANNQNPHQDQFPHVLEPSTVEAGEGRTTEKGEV